MRLMHTGVTPALINPRRFAPPRVRSMTRPRMKGPRSLIRTMIERPLRLFVTRTFEPKGNDLCAAVLAPCRRRSPLAVVLVGPAYQDALPHCVNACAGLLTIMVARMSAHRNPVRFKNIRLLHFKFYRLD